MSQPPEDAPSIADALARRAGYYAEAGQHGRAEEQLRRALALAPDDPLLHHRLSMALSYQDRDEEAEYEARETLRLLPDSAGARMHLARLLMDRGAHVEAELALVEALRLEPELSHAWLVYGLLMFKTGHLAKAEQLLRRSLALAPEDATAHAYLGLVLADAKRVGDARAMGAAGVALDPGDAGGHALLGRSLLLSGRPWAARAALREALRLDPSNDVWQAWHRDADRACRAIYWPMYAFNLLIDRLPGKEWAVWGGMLALIYGLRAAGVDPALVSRITLGWLAFVIYSWLARPLVDRWIRLLPAP